MEGSQKRTSPTTDKQKSTPLDEGIGEDFLTTWKSTAMGEDKLDFNCKTPPGRNKSFKFDKLDMNFGLDDSFNHLSSFKIHLPGLDFPSPPKKSEKPKERSGGQSNIGSQQGKKDLFNLDFDFNDSGFDLDLSSPKWEKKSSKDMNAMELHCTVEPDQNQDSRSKVGTEIDKSYNSDTKILPTLESGPAPKVDCLLERLGELDGVNDDSPCSSADHGNQKMSKSASSEGKQVNVNSSESQRENSRTEIFCEESEKKGFTGKLVQHAIPDLATQSYTSDDAKLETEEEVQPGICLMDVEVSTDQSMEQNSTMKQMMSRDSSTVSSYNLEHSPLTIREELPTSDSEDSYVAKENIIATPVSNSENQSHIANENVTAKECIQHNTNDEAAAITSIRPAKLCMMNDTRRNSNLIPMVISSPLHRESRIDKPIPLKEKGVSLHSMFLKKYVEADSQMPSSSKSSSLCDKENETMYFSPVEGKSQHIGGRDVHRGNPLHSSLKALNITAAKRIPVKVCCEKKDNVQNTSGLQVFTANLQEQTATCSTPKSLNSKVIVPSIALIGDSKTVSVARPKVSPPNLDKRGCDISSLKISRISTSKSEPSNSSVQKDIKSVRYSDQGMHVKIGSEVVYPVNKGKTTLLSPSLKRKTFESNADSMILKPLKRVLESPNGSRKIQEASQIMEEKKKFHNNCHDYPSPAFDVPPDASVSSLEVQILIENDGNVEKAEACSKELENICSMLKKKHDEAKEILVRAVVNNNLLLMLNHPIYEDKIRKIQKFASNMMSKESQS